MVEHPGTEKSTPLSLIVQPMILTIFLSFHRADKNGVIARVIVAAFIAYDFHVTPGVKYAAALAEAALIFFGAILVSHL
jgi:hypothetical protein